MRQYLLLLAVLVPALAYGQGFSKVGTSAAQFLKIGVGARGAGLGEAYVAAANDADALYWNPAGIARLRSISLTVGHAQWFADLSHNFAGLSVPLGESDAIGFSAIRLSAPEQEVTTVESPEGTGVYYQVSDLAIGLTYARALTDRFAVGLTGKFVQQNAYNESASAFALDIGTTLQTGFHGLTIGMCLSNFGESLKLDGRDLLATSDVATGVSGNYNPNSHLTTEEWPLPLSFRVGIAVDIIGRGDAFVTSDQHRITLALDGNHPNDNAERGSIGAEYGWQEAFFLRAGYKINYDIERWTFGAGVKVGFGEQRLLFDYAYVDYGDLGKTSRFSLGVAF
jgi:hypothetical protein